MLRRRARDNRGLLQKNPSSVRTMPADFDVHRAAAPLRLCHHRARSDSPAALEDDRAITIRAVEASIYGRWLSDRRRSGRLLVELDGLRGGTRRTTWRPSSRCGTRQATRSVRRRARRSRAGVDSVRGERKRSARWDACHAIWWLQDAVVPRTGSFPRDGAGAPIAAGTRQGVQRLHAATATCIPNSRTTRTRDESARRLHRRDGARSAQTCIRAGGLHHGRARRRARKLRIKEPALHAGDVPAMCDCATSSIRSGEPTQAKWSPLHSCREWSGRTACAGT